jgi:TonB family protein
MGYQALLFCPDEKLARVISQVFSELDFSVDPVHEPFAAVKQLMAQRYDAIVVDCENEQNASLLFRSARNSTCNQSSLAFALVEGQNGVAKAYRIGANLVLTKPINVEQAKGTLRVARGLLRKSSDAAGTHVASATTAAVAPKPNPSSSGTVIAATAAPAISFHEQFTPSTLPSASSRTITAVASVPDNRGAASTATQSVVMGSTKPTEDIQPISPNIRKDDAANKNVVIERDKATTESVSATAQNAPSAAVPGSAVATAPAKDLTSSPTNEKEKESKTVEAKLPANTRPTPVIAPVLISSASSAAMDAPFAALTHEHSAAADRNKKILIAAAIVLALAALGYLSDGRLAKFLPSPNSQPANPPQNSGQASPAAKPIDSTVAEPSAGKRNSASSSSIQHADRQTASLTPRNKPSPQVGDSETTRIAANSEPGIRKAKSTPLRPKTPPRTNDPAPPPSNFVAGSANNGSLSSLMSASYNPDKPSLATLRVSQGVSQGLLIKRVQPKYPATAVAAHAGGSVEIEATINKEGNVTNPKVLKGNPLLAQAALEAIRQWRYKPYYLDGQPVEIQTQVTINFKAN